ncbi:MAG TPA: hypothetical protein VMM13_10725 [Euzebya sp.]|nr:hypothetical protein [Euzebya sp.]
MSTAVSRSPGPLDTAVGRSADLRRRTRWLAALIMPIGPTAVAVLRFQLPYFTADGGADVAASVIVDTGGQSLVLWMGLVAIMTLVPGVLWVGRLTRRHHPRLTATAMLMLVPGYLSLSWLIAQDILLWTGAREGIDAVALGGMYETWHPTSVIAAGLFVLGHVIGTVILGIALWRSRTVPRVAAAMTAVSQPLHFIAAVVLVSPGLDLVAWGMNAVGFAAAAVAVVRLADDDWDLPPVPRAASRVG